MKVQLKKSFSMPRFWRHSSYGSSKSYDNKNISMTATIDKSPLGVRVLRWLFPNIFPNRCISRESWYRLSVLILTFLCYTTYHFTRKPLSVVKNVLNRNCTDLVPAPEVHINSSNQDNWCDWKPFDGSDSETLLGALDSGFLFAYAIAMFGSGIVAERVDLRYFLTLGMLFSAIFTYLFGIGYTFEIHDFAYYFFIQVLSGLFQTTGWPGVVTCIGNWFGKGRRGVIFGIWNSHTSLGNILGSVVPGIWVEKDWSLSFIVPAVIMGLMSVVIFLFLVTDPRHVGCQAPNQNESQVNSSPIKRYSGRAEGQGNTSTQQPSRVTLEYDSDTDARALLEDNTDSDNAGTEQTASSFPNEEQRTEAISFGKALKIPGVAEYSLCLFFAKLVTYTFLFWLPRYIKLSTTFSAKESANLSALFDVGGIVGGILAGYISDHSGMNATTCGGMLIVAIPMMLVYDTYGSTSLAINIILLMIVGLLVNGPYALITTAVAAELGTSLQGNAKALATVTGIIDGTGSIGAAVGPLLAGLVSSKGWNNVFYMLMISDVIALLLLTRLIRQEFARVSQRSTSNKREI